MGLIFAVSARLSQAVLLLLAMSLIGFIGIHSIGNPVFNVVNIETATPEDIRRATAALGLDLPIWQQYGLFLKNVVSGNFGTSYIYHQPAFKLVLGKLPATLELACAAMLLSAITGVGLGLVAGRRKGTEPRSGGPQRQRLCSQRSLVLAQHDVDPDGCGPDRLVPVGRQGDDGKFRGN